MLKFQCTLEILNLLAVSRGQNGRIKAVNAVVSLKTSSDGSKFICISTNKSLEARQYSTSSISCIRKSFLHEGKLTIMIKDPAVNLMLRNADVKLLTKFVEEISINSHPSNKVLGELKKYQTLEGKGDQGSTTNQSDSIVTSPAQASTSEISKIKNLLTGSCPTSLKKLEASSIRKKLKTHNGILKVKKKSEYPVGGFDRDLKEIVMNDLLLKKVDSRLLRLNNLRVLNLVNNRITSIETLMMLESQLRTLVLDTNRIGSISEDFFTALSTASLEHLSLNDNELTCLPRSILRLAKLQYLSVSRNKLAVLPYNMHLMSRLTNLALDGNRLTFLPKPLLDIRLGKLDISDNCFPESPSTQSLQTDKIWNSFPTLFELASHFVATYNYKNRGKFGKELPVTPSILPAIACDMIEACKHCRKCDSMTTRFTARDTLSISNADSLITYAVCKRGKAHFPSKTVLCENCVEK